MKSTSTLSTLRYLLVLNRVLHVRERLPRVVLLVFVPDPLDEELLLACGARREWLRPRAGGSGGPRAACAPLRNRRLRIFSTAYSTSSPSLSPSPSPSATASSSFSAVAASCVGSFSGPSSASCAGSSSAVTVVIFLFTMPPRLRWADRAQPCVMDGRNRASWTAVTRTKRFLHRCGALRASDADPSQRHARRPLQPRAPNPSKLRGHVSTRGITCDGSRGPGCTPCASAWSSRECACGEFLRSPAV